MVAYKKKTFKTNADRIQCLLFMMPRFMTFESVWKRLWVWLAVTSALGATPLPLARAGVFDLPAFIEPGHVSLGLEPEVALNHGVGLSGNLKPKLGINDLMNAELTLGTGVGERRFRAGGTLDLEWFPDVGRQPGVATPLSIQFINLKTGSDIQFFATPLIYKTFPGQGPVSYTPYLGLPLGWAANDGILRGFTQVALGTMIQTTSVDRLKFNVEVGFNIHKSYSYISGGLVFYFMKHKNLDQEPGAVGADGQPVPEAGALAPAPPAAKAGKKK